jgi:two-component system NtrC family sensor kinase
LICSGRTIGVLGVDNRESGEGFSEKHVTLISTLADYAAIAIENAKLYSETEVERNKLENILTQIEDGVIVVGESNELILVNRRARLAFDLGDEDLSGKNLEEVFDNRDLLRAIRGEALDPQRIELKADDAHFYRVQVTNIQDIGTVATLQDISYLKELDRIKTDFVNTVSHDLRSPLTSILGYVELIKRAGLVNENQEEYIQRVQMSVHSITSLISELLDLGRIEVGLFDEFELVSLSPILEESLNGLQPRLIELKQNLTHDIPDKLPSVYGDPIQLRQLLDNLIGNAIKYTQNGGEIKVTGTEEDNKVIIRVADNGRGIPLEEQANIFDRFFRASNVPDSSTGTGLGLAITKSIVENHRGRIWVDSALGKGSVFTVVLPTSKT